MTQHNLLDIRNIKTLVNGKTILDGLNLQLKRGSTIVIFGPNGSGKTSLLKTILGISGFKITAGDLLFNGTRLNNMGIDKRARLGIALMFQKPPKIAGISLYNLLEILGKEEDVVNDNLKYFNLDKIKNRDVNSNFSGGELKRSELAQIALQKADLYLLDEPDSGVDVDNIKLISKEINNLIRNNKSAIIITHTGEILKYLKADKAYVMIDGKMYCEGKPDKLFKFIQQHGYRKCIGCKKKHE
jgi:Fe-S cluster assembly ATP-binding protein